MMEQYILVNGLETKNVGMVYKFGEMAPDMKVSGKMVKQTAKVNSGTSMETFMKEHGPMTKLMVKELIPMQTDPHIQVNGSKICSMDLVVRLGKMDLNMRVNTKSGKNMVKVFTNGKTAHLIMEIGLKMISMEKANIIGMMADFIQVIGKRMICTDKVNMFGQMVEPLKESINKIKNTVLEYISGLMVEYMKEIGRMVNNMDKENSPVQITLSKKECGRMASGPTGSITSKLNKRTATKRSSTIGNNKTEFNKLNE